MGQSEDQKNFLVGLENETGDGDLVYVWGRRRGNTGGVMCVGETTLLTLLRAVVTAVRYVVLCYILRNSDSTSKPISFPLYFPSFFSLDLTGLSSGHFAVTVTDPLGVIPLPQLVLFGQPIRFRFLLCLIANCPPRSSLTLLPFPLPLVPSNIPRLTV